METLENQREETHLRVSQSETRQSDPWVGLLRRPDKSGLLANASRILALPLVLLVVVYQKTLSPDHGMLKPWFPYGYCKFHPSCSEYARLILREEGITGVPKIILRLIKCRPGVSPQIDQP